MKPVEALEVRLSETPETERVVGRLVLHERRILFEYAADFLERPLWLSPFKLPPRAGVFEQRDRGFGPLFGLFDDSLPDGWGLLLMDHHFRRLGVGPAQISPLDRLAYLGTRTMGALTYHPPSDAPPEIVAPSLDLDRLARESLRALRGPEGEILPQLLRAGGSPGGARPKVLVGRSPDGGADDGEESGLLVAGDAQLPPGFEPWLIKFHGETDSPDAGVVELIYAEMARDAGLTLPETRLFTTPEGGRYFGVRRFDRDTAGTRRHVHTFGNLIHADFRVPGVDSRDLLHVTRVLTRDQDEVLEAFRRVAFNVAAHNRDDHVKNFAFQWTDEAGWRNAPAYDLTFAPGPGGEHTMTVADEGRAPTREHLRHLADGAQIPRERADETLDQVLDAVARWRPRARARDVDGSLAEEIARSIDQCLARLVG